MRTLILSGSGEFTKAMAPTDEHIFTLLPRGKQSLIGVLPTAAGNERHPGIWIRKAQRHYRRLGGEVLGIDVYKRDDTNNEVFVNQVKMCDLLYFSGGTPGYLKRTLEHSPVWETVHERYNEGIFLAGSSAGAMIMGNYTLADPERDMDRGQELEIMQGFSLLPFMIIPHFDYLERNIPHSKDFVDSLRARFERLLCIDENTTLIISNEKKATVSGPGRVVILDKDGKRFFRSGETLDLDTW